MEYKYYKHGLIYYPPHLEKKLTSSQAKFMLSKQNCWFLRNCYDFDRRDRTSFWFIIKDSFDGMDELSSKTRNQVRRAQKCLDIKLIDLNTMVNQGYEVYSSAFLRYKNGRQVPIAKGAFIAHLYKVIPNREWWGCFDRENGKLIAYAENYLYDDMCEYSTLKVIPDYLKGYYPLYGLIYAMNSYYIGKVKYVNDGSRSLTEHSNIQSFLEEKFLFRKAYCCIDVYYCYWLKWCIKCIFPFRKIVRIKSVQAILRQESMARGLE